MALCLLALACTLVPSRAHRLREIHGVVSQAAGRLADPTTQDLLRELEQRFAWGGIAVDGSTPVRAFANRSIVSSALVRPDSLAAERQAEALETAIVEWRRIELERYVSVGCFADSPNGSFRVWPLQLLFHNIGWYLVFEEGTIDNGVGLIRSERIDRLALRRSERGNRRSDEAHSQALLRLELLLHHSGGIHFGNDLKNQLRLASPNARIRARQLVTLRCCSQGLVLCLHPRRPAAQPDRAHPLLQAPGWRALVASPQRPARGWSPAAPVTCTPIRWSSTCPPGPWSATSTCATGSLASGPASASTALRP
ncbi:MAG: WYL domain-containing protein [Cyanobacteria bacterium M_surface_9_m1_291]|nr:WYL domain-containing protein [Cyanobacteria bacterium M_surface_9_m1_291]